MGSSKARNRAGKAAGAPIDSNSDNKGLREESSATSAIAGPTVPRMVGVRPSNTLAAAMFALFDS